MCAVGGTRGPELGNAISEERKDESQHDDNGVFVPSSEQGYSIQFKGLYWHLLAKAR